MSAVFEEIRKGTTGALDRAKLVFSTEVSDDTEEQQPDRLEELAEYCPQLTFQQVSRQALWLAWSYRRYSRLVLSQRLFGFAVSFSLGCKWIFAIDWSPDSLWSS